MEHPQLAGFILGAVIAIAGVMLGFWLAWRMKNPDTPLIDKKFDPGPTDQEEMDIFTQALEPPVEEKKERGISTL